MKKWIMSLLLVALTALPLHAGRLTAASTSALDSTDTKVTIEVNMRGIYRQLSSPRFLISQSVVNVPFSETEEKEFIDFLDGTYRDAETKEAVLKAVVNDGDPTGGSQCTNTNGCIQCHTTDAHKFLADKCKGGDYFKSKEGNVEVSTCNIGNCPGL